MRSTWTDSRLDDFAAHTDRRFDAVDRRFDKVDGELREIRGEIGALHRTIIQFAAVAIAAQSFAQAEMRSRFGQQSYVRHLKPPALRLAPAQSEDAFFADAARIRAALDKARKEPPPGGGIFPALDE